MSAPINDRAEDIRIHPIVVSELKFGDVQRQIFVAHLVECSDHAAFENRPKALNRVRVHRADNILPKVVLDALARILSQAIVNLIGVGGEQAHFFRNHLADERFGVLFGDVIQHASDDVALALNGTDDRSFVSAASEMRSLIPMFVLILAADERFVHLDNAAELLLGLDHRRADFMGHIQRGFVRAKAHLPLNLKRANALFAGRHQMHDFEPLAKRLIRVLKNRPGNVRETIALILGTGIALPLEGHGTDRKNFDVPAARAIDAIGPTASDQIPLAGIFIPGRKHCLKLGLGHLVDRLGSDAARCHNGVSYRLWRQYNPVFRASQEADNRLPERRPSIERDSLNVAETGTDVKRDVAMSVTVRRAQ
jgi:hypothetical protein